MRSNSTYKQCIQRATLCIFNVCNRSKTILCILNIRKSALRLCWVCAAKRRVMLGQYRQNYTMPMRSIYLSRMTLFILSIGIREMIVISTTLAKQKEKKLGIQHNKLSVKDEISSLEMNLKQSHVCVPLVYMTEDLDNLYIKQFGFSVPVPLYRQKDKLYKNLPSFILGQKNKAFEDNRFFTVSQPYKTHFITKLTLDKKLQYE